MIVYPEIMLFSWERGIFIVDQITINAFTYECIMYAISSVIKKLNWAFITLTILMIEICISTHICNQYICIIPKRYLRCEEVNTYIETHDCHLHWTLESLLFNYH